jgi:surface antigen
MGALLGAAGGGAIGAQFGRGSGQLAATAVGTLLGAILGAEAGRSLDRADAAYARTQVPPLPPMPPAVSYRTHTPVPPPLPPVLVPAPATSLSWHGTMVGAPVPAERPSCRPIAWTVQVEGRRQIVYGTACP